MLMGGFFQRRWTLVVRAVIWPQWKHWLPVRFHISNPQDIFLPALRIIIFLYGIKLLQVLKPKQDPQTTSSLISYEKIRKCNLGKSLQCFCLLLECLDEDLEIGDAHIGAEKDILVLRTKPSSLMLSHQLQISPSPLYFIERKGHWLTKATGLNYGRSWITILCNPNRDNALFDTKTPDSELILTG